MRTSSKQTLYLIRIANDVESYSVNPRSPYWKFVLCDRIHDALGHQHRKLLMQEVTDKMTPSQLANAIRGFAGERKRVT